MRNQISHRDITFKHFNLEMFSKAFRGLRFRTRKCYVPLYTEKLFIVKSSIIIFIFTKSQ